MNGRGESTVRMGRVRGKGCSLARQNRQAKKGKIIPFRLSMQDTRGGG